MEKIKSVLSHGSRKSTDATHDDLSKHPDSSTVAPTGQGSHFAASGTKSETLPIYDEMTHQSPHATSSRQPVNTNEAPPHFSNTASLKHSSATSPSTARPELSATPASSQPGGFNEGGSTASIKSGVIGFPQGEDSHAALNKTRRTHHSQGQGTAGLDQTQSQNVGRDTALGDGFGGNTGTVHQLHHQRDHDDLRASSTGQSFDQSFREPQLTTDTDRSFPLAGGVTTRKQADFNQASHPAQSQPTAIVEREPGTKESNLPASHNQGREGIASAAALATAAGVYSATSARNSHQPERLDREHAGHGALSGLGGSRLQNDQVSSYSDYDNLRAEHELRSGHEHGILNPTGGDRSLNPSTEAQVSLEQGRDSHHNNLALAAATTAAATASSVPRYDSNQDHVHGGHGHTYSGDPCKANNEPSTNVFTSGPHATDTANLFDPHQEPHLHIPGEFPETPAETPLDQQAGATGGYIGGNSARHEDITNPTGITGEQSHLGRDAAIAGGLGAAGAGAYTATRHHREPADISTAPISSEASPYSSTRMDPRVNPQSAKLEKPKDIPISTQSSPHSHGQVSSSQQGTAAPTSAPVQESEHHYGRNAGIAGAGAGLIGAGAAAAHRTHREGQQPQSNLASSTPGDDGFQSNQPITGHYEPRSTFEPPAAKSSDVFNPRAQSQPEQYNTHSTLGPHNSDTLNRLDPKVDRSEHQTESDHHYGRDAAIAGGTGVAGLGAYEAATKYDEHRSTGPTASMNDQRYDPMLSGAHDPNQVGQHHYGRDAAVAGGLGAAGAGAYTASQHRDGNANQTGSSQNYPTTTTTYPQEHQPQQARDPSHQRYDSVQNPDQHHGKRNAAALGAAGVAGAGGAYAYSQHDAEKAEKERLAQEKAQAKAAEKEHHAQEKAQRKAEEKELEHQRKEQQKQMEHDRKQQQKELDHKLKEQEKAFQHEQHKIEQQQDHDRKHQDKLAAAEGKKLEKERSRRSDELDQDEQEGKEKKHHIFGFLHRDKTKKTRSNESSPRQSREYAGASAAGLGASEISHESDSSEGKKNARHRLHKDPPRGHPAYEALEHQQAVESGNGSTGQSNRFSGDRDTRPGAYDSYPNEQSNKVTEPHTGLPMNVGAYGDGRGGTDGSATIHGYHDVPGGNQGGVTDWEAVRKANTPY